jgi:hypothetical protein
MKAARPETFEMLPDNPRSVTVQTQRRLQMKRFSIQAAEGCALPVEIVADLPICCEPVLSDDGSSVVGINFWVADWEADYSWGEFLGDEAVRYVRDHPGTEILTNILYWMGASLHFEDRGPGALEDGFVYRVLRDYPDAVERMIARSIRGALAGGSLRIRGGEADAIARRSVRFRAELSD